MTELNHKISIVVIQSLNHVQFCDPPGLQPARLLCPPLSSGVCLNSCPLSQWCYLIIVSPSAPFSFCLQSLRRGHRCKICHVALGKGFLGVTPNAQATEDRHTALCCAQSLSRVCFFATLWTVVGCHALFQGLFPIQWLIHVSGILYHWAIRKAHRYTGLHQNLRL